MAVCASCLRISLKLEQFNVWPVGCDMNCESHSAALPPEFLSEEHHAYATKCKRTYEFYANWAYLLVDAAGDWHCCATLSRSEHQLHDVDDLAGQFCDGRDDCDAGRFSIAQHLADHIGLGNFLQYLGAMPRGWSPRTRSGDKQRHRNA